MMSSLSATIFFNRRFSSSRTWRRRASEVPKPLYLARQRDRDASVLQYLRLVPAMLDLDNFDPAMIRTISSTGNLDCRMKVSPLSETSHYDSPIFLGAPQQLPAIYHVPH